MVQSASARKVILPEIVSRIRVILAGSCIF